MKNLSKAIIIIFVVLLLLVIFFALTGVDVRQPEQALYILIDKAAQLNRAINQMVRNFFWSIRTTVLGWFGR